MTQLTLDTQVCDIVTALPKSADLFRQNRIDYCCGGKISLQAAALERQLDPGELLENVMSIAKELESRSSLEPAAFGDRTLVAYIQERYHAGLRGELLALAPYITKVARVHGEGHPHLLRIQEIFRILRAELLDHTEDEDTNVFPMILEFLGDPTPELKERLKPHVFELESEHDNAGKLLFELREITNNYTPPEEACGTYRLVYARLEQLEKDTFEHVHLENNVLFDRVRLTI